MISLYDMLYSIDNDFEGLRFDQIYGVSVIGEPLSDAWKHPIQYRATTTLRPGDDDPYEGVGWSPTEAVRNLLKVIDTKPSKTIVPPQKTPIHTAKVSSGDTTHA